MEYIDRGDLSGYIKHQGSKASSQAKQIASQLLEGLVVLHARGICHRDLKPQVRSPLVSHSPFVYFTDAF